MTHIHNNKIHWIDKLIYLSLFVLFAGPFLSPFSYMPVGKFYSEMVAFIMAFFLGVLMIYRSSRLLISPVAIASLLFIVVLLIQIPIFKLSFPGINIYVALQFVVAIVMSVGVTSYINADEDVQKKLVNITVWALVVGSGIQALFGFLQFTGQAANFSSFILYVGQDTNNVLGNIGQKNDYVDFLSMGLFGVIYLFFNKQINKLVFTLLSLLFLVVISATTSRISFSFLLVAIAIFSIFVFVNRKKPEMKASNKQIYLLLLGLFVSLFLIEAILPKISEIFLGHNVTSGLYRFDASSVGQSTYRRFYEWYKDLVIFTQHPILGIGWYRYSHDGIYIMLTDPRFWYIPANSALYTHSHNSPLNILAETGIIGFAITICYGVIYSIYHMFKSFNNYATLFIVFILLTTFTQGLFQYPLWYVYFLMFFILFLSITKPVVALDNTKTVKGVASFGFIILLFSYWVNIPIYNFLISSTMVPKDSDDYVHNVNQLENLVNTNLIWSFPAAMVLDQYNLPGMQLTNLAMPLQDQLKYSDMIADELPYPSVIFKQIITHKMVGDESGSTFYANLLAHAFPYFKDKFAAQLQSDPRFNSQVSTIYNFEYKDKSIFAKILDKKDGQ